jgi:hypothetical protein
MFVTSLYKYIGFPGQDIALVELAMQNLPFDPTKTKIIACTTVIEEMQPMLPHGVAHEVLDFGLHLNPNNLKKILQQAIDNLDGEFNTLILGYGLCSMAVVGLRANNCTLIIPRVDDCIAIFLGSKNAYSEQTRKEPGTYYLTKGWIEVADTPFAEHERLVEQYGEERADRIMRIMLKHYTRLAYIDTGHRDQDRYRQYARMTAKKFNLRFEEIVGSGALIRKLLFGPWDEEILVAPPGHTIEYLDFKIDPTTTSNPYPFHTQLTVTQ